MANPNYNVNADGTVAPIMPAGMAPAQPNYNVNTDGTVAPIDPPQPFTSSPQSPHDLYGLPPIGMQVPQPPAPQQDYQNAYQPGQQAIPDWHKAVTTAQGLMRHPLDTINSIFIGYPNYAHTQGAQQILELLRQTESHGNYQAKNPHTTASGAFQYINGTWNNYGGYSEARMAPRAVQDARMNEDLVRELHRYNGDPFKVIASHMSPALANDPRQWAQPRMLKNGRGWIRSPPIAEYVAQVVKGSDLESQFNLYMQRQALMK